MNFQYERQNGIQLSPKRSHRGALSFVHFLSWYEMESFARSSSFLLYLCDFWAGQTDVGASRDVCVCSHKILKILPDSILAFLAATFLTAVFCWLPRGANLQNQETESFLTHLWLHRPQMDYISNYCTPELKSLCEELIYLLLKHAEQ